MKTKPTNTPVISENTVCTYIARVEHHYFNSVLKVVVAVAAEGGARGARAPQLSRKGGRAPPKLYVCDVINIS